MPLIEDEIISILQKSNDEWRQFQSEYLKDHSRIDISQWIISDKDMNGYHFINCDFRGAILSYVNFDSSTFTNCRMFGCSLKLLSLVRVKIENIILEDVHIEKCTFRQSSLAGVELTRVTGNELTVADSQIKNLDCMELSFENSRLKRVVEKNIQRKRNTLQNIQVENILCDGLKISDCRLNRCSCGKVEAKKMHIQGGQIDECQIADLQANDSEISGVDIHNFQIENGNFINGLFIKINLKEIGIAKIGLMQTAIVDCEWPAQTYQISWCGKYIPSKYLLRQPVEDIIGISPKLRKEIQRAQLVDETHRSCKNVFTKMWLWFWGITTEYGRSLTRLTFLYVIMLIIMILLFIVYFPREALSNSLWECFREGSLHVIFNFIGVFMDSATVFSICLEQRIILVIDRIFGIIFLGLWTGIAANKIGSIN